MKRATTVIATAALTLVAFAAFADPLDTMASKLAALRAEVEALSARVEEAKQTRRAERRSFATQKADLEFAVQREDRRIAQLASQTEKRRERIAESSTDGAELVPAVKASSNELRERVSGGLPFKDAERTGQIDELDAKLDSGLVTPQKAAVQLWALFEDELRLGRENGLYRQVITLDGEELLVDVARLGMVAMYFRTDDERFGWAERAPEGWVWTTTQSEPEARQISVLFEAMRKQIRTGWFELPGGLR